MSLFFFGEFWLINFCSLTVLEGWFLRLIVRPMGTLGCVGRYCSLYFGLNLFLLIYCKFKPASILSFFLDDGKGDSFFILLRMMGCYYLDQTLSIFNESKLFSPESRLLLTHSRKLFTSRWSRWVESCDLFNFLLIYLGVSVLYFVILKLLSMLPRFLNLYLMINYCKSY